MKKTKKLLAVLLAVIMTLTMMPFTVIAEEVGEIPPTGESGCDGMVELPDVIILQGAEDNDESQSIGQSGTVATPTQNAIIMSLSNLVWDWEGPPTSVQDGDTITILTAASSSFMNALQIPQGATVTISGNANTGNLYIHLNGSGSTVIWDAVVTLSDSIHTTGSVEIGGSGLFQMTGGSITNHATANSALWLDGNIDANIGGTVNSSGSFAINAVSGAGSVTINGGAVISGSPAHSAIFVQSGRTLNMTGGTVTGNDDDGAIIGQGNINVIGGTITNKGESQYGLIVNGGTGNGVFSSGATVSLIAGTPPSGQQFSHWTTSGSGTFGNANSASTTFTMPNNHVTVTANWTEAGAASETFDIGIGQWVGTSPAESVASFSGTLLTVNNGANITITGTTTTNRVLVAANATATITLQNASISNNGNSPFMLQGGANVTLNLVDDNTLTAVNVGAGLTVPSNAELTINGPGSLTAQGGAGSVQGGSAGIGGSAPSSGTGNAGGIININSGTVTAIGGNSTGIAGGGAGIGGSGGGGGTGNGTGGAGGTININGGTVIATGGNNANGSAAAGIGGGGAAGNEVGGAGGIISISGSATVNATGGTQGNNRNGAAIGGGGGFPRQGAGGTITIGGGANVTSGGTPLYRLDVVSAGATNPSGSGSLFPVGGSVNIFAGTRSGDTFSGWTSNAGGTFANASQTTTIFTMPASNVTATAVWDAPVTAYNITYNLNGGTVSPPTANPTTYSIESLPITLINPTRFGYNFIGWSGTGITGISMTVTIPSGSTGDRTFTAEWEQITVLIDPSTVTLYNADGHDVIATGNATGSVTHGLLSPSNTNITITLIANGIRVAYTGDLPTAASPNAIAGSYTLPVFRQGQYEMLTVYVNIPAYSAATPITFNGGTVSGFFTVHNSINPSLLPTFATGGGGTFTYTVEPGYPLPAGLQMNTERILTGIPTNANNGNAQTFRVRATCTTTSEYAVAEFTITINRAPTHIPVTSITGVASSKTAGTTITLTGTVNPSHATNRLIVWSAQSAGTTAATISGNTLNTTAAGSVTVRATIVDGTAVGTNYTQDFTITVNAPSGGNENGGDSGGSSPTVPSTPPSTVTTDKQPNMPLLAKQTVNGSVRNGVLHVTITAAMVRSAINAPGDKNDGIAVVFDLSANSAYESISIINHRTALNALITAGVRYVQFNSEVIDIMLDFEAIETVLSQTTGNVTLAAMKETRLSYAARAVIGNRPYMEITIKGSNGVTVSDLKDGTVTLAFAYTPSATEQTGNLYGVHVDNNGRAHLLVNSSYSNGKVMFGISSLSLYGVGYKTPAPAFTDTASHWAKDDIDFVASRGLIFGTGTAFSPNAAITRADFLMALGILSGADVSGYTQSGFSDVPNNSPTMPYIEWAKDNGIVSGIGNNRFSPESRITREQMAVMMINYAKATNYTLPVSRQVNVFADDARISTWAADQVRAIQQAGIMLGNDINMFDPQGDATRGEASAILRRFVELVIDEGTARGWVRNEAGQWQYFDVYGKLVTGWYDEADGDRYWFDRFGVMVSGRWVQIGGKWYYFFDDGKLAVSTIVEGHTVGEDGASE